MWLPVAGVYSLPLIADGAAGITPDSSTPTLYTYAFGWGPLGLAALGLAFLLYKRWRLISPAQEDKIREEARREARADLLAERDRMVSENARLLAENRMISDQRDDALRIARDQMMPLLVNFTASTNSLLPILQTLVATLAPWPRSGRDELDAGGR